MGVRKDHCLPAVKLHPTLKLQEHILRHSLCLLGQGFVTDVVPSAHPLIPSVRKIEPQIFPTTTF